MQVNWIKVALHDQVKLYETEVYKMAEGLYFLHLYMRSCIPFFIRWNNSLSRSFLMLQVIEEKSVVNLRCIPEFLEMQLLSALQIFI